MGYKKTSAKTKRGPQIRNPGVITFPKILTISYTTSEPCSLIASPLVQSVSYTMFLGPSSGEFTFEVCTVDSTRWRCLSILRL